MKIIRAVSIVVLLGLVVAIAVAPSGRFGGNIVTAMNREAAELMTGEKLDPGTYIQDYSQGGKFVPIQPAAVAKQMLIGGMPFGRGLECLMKKADGILLMIALPAALLGLVVSSLSLLKRSQSQAEAERRSA